MGVEGLCKAVLKNPQLVEAVFDRLGRLSVAADRQLVTLDAIGALRQGDDLGFKSATFISPADLRRWVFPIYKRFVAIAHAANKPFILHSCGNLDAVYDDLLDDVGIDAKHSFEEAILPVEHFKRRYAGRVTPLGGIDVDLVCRGSEDEIRRCTREKIAACFADGHYALGTGNSLTDYMPVERYLWVLDEGMRATG
jgi:uroporphyrinogen decarboxylase